MIVDGCIGCPFNGEAERCQIDNEGRDAGWNTVAPEWCQLRRGPVTIKLRGHGRRVPDPNSPEGMATIRRLARERSR